MNLCNIGHEFDYEMEKLIRLFLPFEKITVTPNEEFDGDYALCKVYQDGDEIKVLAQLDLQGKKASRLASVDISVMM